MAKRGFSNMKPKSGNSDSLRLEELIEIYKFTDHPDEWVTLRFLDRDILPVKRHWVKIITGKTKKLVKIPRFCVSFNPDDESTPLEGIECPYCQLSSEGGDDAPMRNEFFYLMNAIVRDIQEDEPARKGKPTKNEQKTGYKEIKSKSWTPVRVVRLTNTVVARMQEIGENNIVTNKKKKTKKAFDVSHSKFGCDVNVKYKPKAAGTDKYSADKVEGRTALSEEESEYLVWNLEPEMLDAAGRMSPEQALEDFKRMDVVGDEAIDDDGEEDDDEDDEDDIPLGRKSKSKKKSKKSKKSSSFDDEDEDEDDDDEDEPPRKSKSKKKPVKKKKSASFDEDDDEDDEDDEPPRKSKSKKKSTKTTSKKKTSKKKKPVDDDDDEDEAPKKKKKKSSSASKKKSSTKKKSPTKKKSSSFDDDDDDDWEDDE